MTLLNAGLMRGLNFCNLSEQLVEVQLTKVWAHAWMLSLFTAGFMLWPNTVNQVIT